MLDGVEFPVHGSELQHTGADGFRGLCSRGARGKRKDGGDHAQGKA